MSDFAYRFAMGIAYVALAYFGVHILLYIIRLR